MPHDAREEASRAPRPVPRRPLSNPLALAVLASLYERPMHPYEMATTMRTRGKDESVRLNFGSLYTVVDALARRGLIEAQETEREGRRPERTVYRITEAGAHELVDWLGRLVGTPDKEFLGFEAGLSYLPVLDPDEAVRLLVLRCTRLEGELGRRRAVRDEIDRHGVPRLFVVEFEYMTALVEAELAWTRGLVADIESGALQGMEMWRGFHAGADAQQDGRDATGESTGARR